MKNTESISWSLLLKKIKGERLTEEEEMNFHRWISDPACKAYFERAVLNWQDETDVPPVDLPKFIRQFDHFVASSEVKTSHQMTYRAKFRRYASYAAAILIPLIVFGGIYYYYNKGQHTVVSSTTISQVISPGKSSARIILDNGEELVLGGGADSLLCDEEGIHIRQQQGTVSYLASNQSSTEEKINTIIIPRGGEHKLILSDGTQVWINSASSLKYPALFVKNERVVELEGEAYFEVAKDASHPFIVKTAGRQVKVYGTAFNIEAYPTERKQYVTLAEGSIGVFIGEKECRLVPGQQAQISTEDNKIEVVEVDASRFCSWHTGQLSLEHERLEDILAKLSRWYDVDFSYADNSLKELHFTGDLERYADFTDMLELIKLTTHVDFIIEGRCVKVISKKQ